MWRHAQNYIIIWLITDWNELIFTAIDAGLTNDQQLRCETHSCPCEELWGVWQNHQLLKASGKQAQVWSWKTRNTVGHMAKVITVQVSHLLDCTVTCLSVSNISFITNTGPLRGQQATAGLRTKHFILFLNVFSLRSKDIKRDSSHLWSSETDWAVTWFVLLLWALSLIIKKNINCTHQVMTASVCSYTLINSFTVSPVSFVAGFTCTVTLLVWRQHDVCFCQRTKWLSGHLFSSLRRQLFITQCVWWC